MEAFQTTDAQHCVHVCVGIINCVFPLIKTKESMRENSSGRYIKALDGDDAQPTLLPHHPLIIRTAPWECCSLNNAHIIYTKNTLTSSSLSVSWDVCVHWFPACHSVGWNKGSWLYKMDIHGSKWVFNDLKCVFGEGLRLEVSGLCPKCTFTGLKWKVHGL